MRSWHEFITMGGYARYVWPAYAVTFVVLVAMAWSAISGLRRTRGKVHRRGSLEDES